MSELDLYGRVFVDRGRFEAGMVSDWKSTWGRRNRSIVGVEQFTEVRADTRQYVVYIQLWDGFTQRKDVAVSLFVASDSL